MDNIDKSNIEKPENSGQNILELIKEKIENFKNADPNKKTIALTVFALAISILVVITFWVNKVHYKTLYKNLNMKDASKIVKELKEKKVNYKLEDNGTTILVPSDQVYQLRLDLAETGLPRNGQIGYELFDKSDFQSSEFTENVKYIRALQGELTDTINHLDAVEESKVNLSIPKRSIYLNDENKPSASVVLKLRSTKKLNDDEVRGIAQLVSSCVDGLTPQGVTIMTTTGKLLSDFIQEGSYGATTYQIKIEKQLQKQLETKVRILLDSVLGSGKSVVNAHVEIKMDKKAVQKELFKPTTDNKGVVRSTQVLSETYDGKSNVPGKTTTITSTKPNPNKSAYEQKSRTTNYEVSKVIEKETVNPGKIKRLSVGVIIDSSSKLTPQQLSDLSAVIASVCGIDTSRGDELTLKTLKFTNIDLAKKTKEDDYLKLLKKYGPAVLAAFSPLLILIILLAQMRKIKKQQKENLSKEQEDYQMEMTDQLNAPDGSTFNMVSSDLAGPTDLYPPTPTSQDGVTAPMAPSGSLKMGGYDNIGPQPQEIVRNFARENPKLVAAVFEKWLTQEE